MGHQSFLISASFLGVPLPGVVEGARSVHQRRLSRRKELCQRQPTSALANACCLASRGPLHALPVRITQTPKRSHPLRVRRASGRSTRRNQGLVEGWPELLDGDSRGREDTLVSTSQARDSTCSTMRGISTRCLARVERYSPTTAIIFQYEATIDTPTCSRGHDDSMPLYPSSIKRRISSGLRVDQTRKNTGTRSQSNLTTFPEHHRDADVNGSPNLPR